MAILTTYNNSPPPDDGSATANNEVKWATIKEKLTDPLKDWIDNPDFDGNELTLDADGDTSITADTDDRIDIKVGGSDVFHLTDDGLNIGNTPNGWAANLIDGAFTSDGSSTLASGFYFNQTVTGANGDTSNITGFRVDPNLLTQGNSETIGDVASLRVDEPNITVGSGDTVTNASTLHISGAPTEGSNNYSLLIDSGLAHFGGGATGIVKTGSYTGDGSTSQAITGIGFQVKRVRIWTRATVDNTEIDMFESNDVIVDDNAAGGAFRHRGSGGTSTFETNAIIALGSDGFTVDDDGADADPNANGVTYNYEVMS